MLKPSATGCAPNIVAPGNRSKGEETSHCVLTCQIIIQLKGIGVVGEREIVLFAEKMRL